MKSHAKINLALDILGKDKNYHLVETVICEVPDLYDEIEVKILRDGKSQIEIITNNEELNANKEENSVRAAVKLLAGNNSVKITIKKNIPLRSGLGGGSSNAATVLKELNDQLNLNLTTPQLRTLAAKISMDTPFFITGGVARATHYGEIIEPIRTDLILKPKIIFSTKSQKSSTGEMFAKIDNLPTGQNREKTKKLIRALENNDMQSVIKNLHNDFELLQVVSCKLPVTLHLSGSGPTCFKLLQ
ncbi:MAG: 4-(cytidine 5'-diphospho)-2-C-methyl-D-erythritol kinase [Candidatus Gracilibacteria bacterium]